jgi:hypothetical protein
MESSVSGIAPDANALVLDAEKSGSLLGIEPVDLENLRREIWMKFFDEASLPRVVEAEWETVLSSRKIPDPSVDLALTFALTTRRSSSLPRPRIPVPGSPCNRSERVALPSAEALSRS